MMSLDFQRILQFVKSVNVLLLIPHGRSGSLFVQSLFDGHPQVIQFPGWWQEYGFCLDGSNDCDGAIESFCSAYRGFFDSRLAYLGDTTHSNAALLGDDGSEHIEIDVDAFKRCLREILQLLKDHFSQIDDKLFLKAIHAALALQQQKDLLQIRYMLFHLHKYKGTDKLIQDFPETRFIALTRDIRESWASWQLTLRSYYGILPGTVIMNLFIESIHEWMTYYRNLKLLCNNIKPGNVKVLDLNKLHVLQEKAMKHFSEWLVIDYSECLTKSTFMGKLWWGNSADRKPMSGFSADKAIFRWQKLLSFEEQEIVYHAAHNLLLSLGYETIINIKPNAEIDQMVITSSWIDPFSFFKSASYNAITRKTTFKHKLGLYLPVPIMRFLEIISKAPSFIFRTYCEQMKVFLRRKSLLREMKQIDKMFENFKFGDNVVIGRKNC